MLFILCSLLIAACGQPESIPTPDFKTETFVLKSTRTGDSYRIWLHEPKNMPRKTTLPLYLYLDADIKSGVHARNAMQTLTNASTLAKGCWVGVGHISDFHSARRRDFIPPSIWNKDDPMYGHADKFHEFLEKELLPEVKRRTGKQFDTKTLLGHSFGGLYSVYESMREDPLFDHYVAASASLWVNDGDIHRYRDPRNPFKQKTKLYLGAGGLETLNMVLSSNNGFVDSLMVQNDDDLLFQYQIYKGYSHNGGVPVIYSGGLEWLAKQD